MKRLANLSQQQFGDLDSGMVGCLIKYFLGFIIFFVVPVASRQYIMNVVPLSNMNTNGETEN